MKKIQINSIKSLICGIIDRITGLPDYRITGLRFARRRDGHGRVRVAAPLPEFVLPA